MCVCVCERVGERLTEFEQEFLAERVLRAAQRQAADERGRVRFYGNRGHVCERERERHSHDPVSDEQLWSLLSEERLD